MKHTNVNTKALMAAAIVNVAFLCGSNALHAGEQKKVYTLTAIEDESFGEEVVAGNYDTAIEGILSSRKAHPLGFEAQTNLCVAYTRSGDFTQAGRSCDAALAALERRIRRASGPGYAPFQLRRVKEKYLAVALSNRGVLRALSGKPDLARQDFIRAAGLRYGLDVADANLAKLGSAGAPVAEHSAT